MKLAFCTDGIFPNSVGGMQRHSRLLLEELSKFDIEITVFHPHDENLFSNFDNITEIYIPDIDKTKNYLRENYRYSKRIYNYLKNMPEHIVYSQGLSVWFGIKNLSNKIIVNPHGLEPYQVISKKDKLISIPFKIIFNYIFKNADFVISLGGMLTDILKKRIPKTKLVVFPNAVNLPDYKKEYSDKYDKIKLFFISRFAHNKGIDLLLEVANTLNSEGVNNIEYILGGKGPLFKELNEKYSSENIKFLGFVSDEELIDLYKNSGFFVLPTLFEGMPTVVLEAMSYSLPIVVTNVGATAELVDESNGFLIRKNNTEELKSAIIKIINLSPDKRKEFGENSFNKVKNNFTWEIVAQKHYDFFKQIL